MDFCKNPCLYLRQRVPPQGVCWFQRPRYDDAAVACELAAGEPLPDLVDEGVHGRKVVGPQLVEVEVTRIGEDLPSPSGRAVAPHRSPSLYADT